MQTQKVVSLYFLAILGTVCVLKGGVVRASFCKWVDEQGVTHYAEKCPKSVDAKPVKIQPPPSEQQVEAARMRSEALLREKTSRPAPAMKQEQFRSMPLEQLGPLPENTTSIYLRTIGAELNFNTKKLTGQFYLRLKAREGLPRGALLEAHFPNPANLAREDIVSKVLPLEKAAVRMLSPQSDGFKCWNYEVEVLVYNDKSKSKLLDTHTQTIQSRADLSQVVDALGLMEAILGKKCPSIRQDAMKGMSVEQLEELCEREREKHIKPMREERIERCKADGSKSDEHCETYWSDFGDAVRINPRQVRPALFYDLPECIAAKQARKEGR